MRWAEGGGKEIETEIETEIEMEIGTGEIKVGWILVTLWQHQYFWI